MEIKTLKEVERVSRLKKLFTQPLAYWEEVEPEPGGLEAQLVPQVLVLAALPAVSMMLGQTLRLVRSHWILGPLAALFGALLYYGFTIASWLFLGYLIDFLADFFGARRELRQSLKLATGAVVPLWIMSVLQAIPFIGFILGPLGGLAGLAYGCYVLSLGLPRLTGAPADRSLVYAIATMALFFMATLLAMALAFCPVSCLVMQQGILTP